MTVPKDPEKYKQTIERMSKARLGKIPWNKGTKGICKIKTTSFKIGHVPWNKGKKTGIACHTQKHTEESKKKMSESLKGMRAWNKGLHNWMSPEGLQNIKKHRALQKYPLKDTKIEIQTRMMLDALNIPYIPHYMLRDLTFGYHPLDIMVMKKDGSPHYGIEIDGCYWHSCPEHHPWSRYNGGGGLLKVVERDKLIDQYCEKNGIPLIRLWEHDIKKNVFNMNIIQRGRKN